MMKKQGSARHLATPRTLLFLERDQKWLFMQGAAHKWWAGRFNGIGGSVEAGEDILSAALREAEEETALRPEQLDLAAIIHIVAEPAVLLFVFLGTLPPGELRPCNEGTFHWLSRQELADSSLPLMSDLPFLLARLWKWQAKNSSLTCAAGPLSGHASPLYFLYDFSDGFVAQEGRLPL